MTMDRRMAKYRSRWSAEQAWVLQTTLVRTREVVWQQSSNSMRFSMVFPDGPLEWMILIWRREFVSFTQGEVCFNVFRNKPWHVFWTATTVARTWFQIFTQTKSSNHSAAWSDRRRLVFRLICVCICFLCLRNFGFWPCRIEWLRKRSGPSAMFRMNLWQAGLIAAEDASFVYHRGWGAPSVGCSVWLALRSMCVLKTIWLVSQKFTQLVILF